MTYIKTKRLLFRDYNHSDVECLKKIMQERDTMQYFPSVFSNSEVEALVKEMSGSIRDRGFGLFGYSMRGVSSLVVVYIIIRWNSGIYYCPEKYSYGFERRF